jgi:membrane-associated phospholipid phosphatase
MIDPDQVIHDALNSHVLPAYYWFFATITWLGSASLWVLILAGCLVIKRWRKIAVVLIIVIAFSALVNADLKELIRRNRPADVSDDNYFIVHSFSFPSGHAQTAFVIATTLAAFIARRYNIVTFLLAAAVGMSRVYLGVHYFTDVVAGAATGLLAGVLAIYAIYRFGLCDEDGLFAKVFRALKIKPGKLGGNANAIKNGIGVLMAGYLIALVASYISWYIVSLAVIAITYLVLLTPALNRSLLARC